MSGILGWLHGLFSSAVELPGVVADYVERAFSVVWHTLTDVFVDVHKGWDDMLRGARALALLVKDAATATYLFGRWVVQKAIPDVLHWTARQLAHLADTIAAGLEQLRGYLLGLIDKLHQFVDGIMPWVLQKVWTPLHNAITAAANWIGDQGAYVYHLLTHPDQLAALLLAPLWVAFLALLVGSERRIAQWLTAGIYAAMLETANIAEDIMAKII